MEFTAFDLTSQAADATSGWQPSSGGVSHAAAYRHTFEQARIADVGGLDTYFLTEHHFSPGFQVVPSPHLLVAALSQCTTQVRLGVMCTNLPLHHPVRVAEEIRMMDLLTDGRLEMGFGRGTAAHEQVGYGVDRGNAECLFDEGMSLLKHLLTAGEIESYSAGPWQGGAVVIVPDGVQRPHPPLWMAGVSEKSIRKAARMELNLCTAFLDHSDAARTSQIYRDAWQESHPGTPCGKYGTLQHIFVAETDEDARRWARPQIEGWLQAGLQAALASKGPDAGVDTGYEEHQSYLERITALHFDEAVAKGRVIYGTPDQCVDQLLEKAECGVDMFQGWFQFGALDHAASNRSLELFCTEVAPAVRAAMNLDPTQPVTA